MEIDTKVVHGGQKPDGVTGAIAPPIYQTSTFAFKNAEHGARLFKGEEEGYIYTRVGNPTIDLLAKKIALLESAEAGVVFASGLAAIFSTIITIAGSDDHIISDDTIYGGTYSQFNQVLSRLGISVTFVDMADLNRVEGAIKENTKLIFTETPDLWFNAVVGQADNCADFTFMFKFNLQCICPDKAATCKVDTFSSADGKATGS